jgi:cytochrome P450
MGGWRLWLRSDGLVPLIGRNTLTTSGEEWWANRQRMQPSFHPRQVDRGVAPFAAGAAEAIGAWRDFAASGALVDMAMEGMRVVVRYGTRPFGFDVTADEARELPEAVLRAQRWGFRRVVGGMPVTPQSRRDIGLLASIVRRAIDAPPSASGAPSYAERLRQDHDVPREALRDHLLLALLAASDNPPNTFAYTIWLLARHPEIQEAVRREVRATLGQELPTAEALEAMPLLQRVVWESMRILPGIWMVMRRATRDTTLRGVRVPKGAMVLPLPYYIHRHPDFWPDPERFDPDRFLPDAVAARPKSAFIPFGSGPRMCIGARLATQEVRAMLAVFLQRFRAFDPPDAVLPLEGGFALRSRTGVRVRLQSLEA